MDAWERFERFMAGERMCKPSSVVRCRSALASVQRLTGKPFLSDPSQRVTEGDVKEIIRARVYAPPTVAKMVWALKAWETFGGEEGWFVPNGILKLKVRQPAPTPKPSLTRWQIRMLFAACQSPKDYRLVYLGLFAGLRISDCEQVSAEHFLEDRLRFQSIKNSRWVEVPLHPDLEMARDVILSESVRPYGLKVVARRLRQRVRFPFTAHYLRRTFSQNHLDRRVSIDVVEDLMGHAPRSTLLQSYGVPWNLKVDAMTGLSY